MGSTGTSTVIGPVTGPLEGQGLPLNSSVVVFTTAMSNSYATGGDTVTLPTDVRGEIVALDIISSGADFANRTYIWNGVAGSGAKIIAMDAYKTEEGNATNLSSVTLTCLAILSQ